MDGLAGAYFALRASEVNREHKCFHLKIPPEFITFSNSFRSKVDSSPERQTSVEGCQSPHCFVGFYFKLIIYYCSVYLNEGVKFLQSSMEGKSISYVKYKL